MYCVCVVTRIFSERVHLIASLSCLYYYCHYWYWWGYESCVTQGHVGRNRKTSLMFTVALAFLIFAGVIFTLQADSLTRNIQAFLGADLVVMSGVWEKPLPKARINAYLLNEEDRLPPQTPAPSVVMTSSTTLSATAELTPKGEQVSKQSVNSQSVSQSGR